MTPLQVEEAWAAAMAPIVAPITSLAGIGVEVLPPGETLALADCEVCNHRGGGYWTAAVRLKISSPALESDPLPAFALAWNALGEWLEDSEAVHEAFSSTDFTLKGYFVKTAGNTREDNHNVGEINLVCGIERTI